LKESDVGILDSLLRRRKPTVEFRTIDGGHPAPFPDMTDEQLYNYEVAFNVPSRTFDKPPVPDEPTAPQKAQTTTQPERPLTLPPLDLSKPVRLISSRQPVEIITTRARHPVYKVHAYIGDDDVVTLFTLDGQLSENGPRCLENVPQRRQLFLNIYPKAQGGERYLMTQHDTRQAADAAARPGRIACVPVHFDL
jgi:hypothetical protein